MCILVFYDLETTGLNTKTDRIISIGWIITDCHFNELERGEVVVNPLCPISPKASEVNGFTQSRKGNLLHEGKFVKGTMRIGSALRHFKKIVERNYCPVCRKDQNLLYIAHGGHAFDEKILNAELERCQLSLPKGIWADTLPMARGVYKERGRGGYSLQSLAKLTLGRWGDEYEQTHNALDDADLLFQFFKEMFEDHRMAAENPDCPAHAPADLLLYDAKHCKEYELEDKTHARRLFYVAKPFIHAIV